MTTTVRPGGLIVNHPGGQSECLPHGKRWPEGDLVEAAGGRACQECVESSQPPPQ